jgi:small nuclear ribonucleoprotein (snRNP)-like protein
MSLNHSEDASQFLHRHVAIKLREGPVIEGKLIHIDISQKHNGIGNLILADRTIIRGSYVQHIAFLKQKRRVEKAACHSNTFKRERKHQARLQPQFASFSRSTQKLKRRLNH